MVCDFILTGLFFAPDTSHVPCKFFRQGACQAGNACPFSHDLSAASETVCKYFAKVRWSSYCPLHDRDAHLPMLADGAVFCTVVLTLCHTV